jgi:hypothetical protein
MVISPATTVPLYRVNADGGAPVQLTQIDTALHTSHRWPFFLPDGKHFLYLAINHDPSKSANDTIYYTSVDGSVNKPLLKSQSNAVYADGYLLFARNDQVMAQSFNPSSGSLTGQPQPLIRGVTNDPTTWHMDVSASNDGLLLYGSGASGAAEILWMDRASKQISTIAGNISNLYTMKFSPQGDRIALGIDNGVDDTWILDIARGIRTVSRLARFPITLLSGLPTANGSFTAPGAAASFSFSVSLPTVGARRRNCSVTIKWSLPWIGRAMANTSFTTAASPEPRTFGRYPSKVTESPFKWCLLLRILSGAGPAYLRTATGWPTRQMSPVRTRSM